MALLISSNNLQKYYSKRFPKTQKFPLKILAIYEFNELQLK